MLKNIDRELDYKVMGRGSVLLADDNIHLGGLFKKIFKKIKKVTMLPVKLTKKSVKLQVKLAKKSVKIPTKIAKKAVKVVGKISGKTWKKIGAVTAVAVATYFGGPLVLGLVSKMGGTSIASKAGSSATQQLVSTAIKSTVSIAQQKAIKKRTKKMTQAQILADQEISDIARQIAVAEAANKAQASKKLGAELLANEGAIEIQNQTQKIAGVSNDTLLKFGIPAAVLLVSIL